MLLSAIAIATASWIGDHRTVLSSPSTAHRSQTPPIARAKSGGKGFGKKGGFDKGFGGKGFGKKGGFDGGKGKGKGFGKGKGKGFDKGGYGGDSYGGDDGGYGGFREREPRREEW